MYKRKSFGEFIGFERLIIIFVLLGLSLNANLVIQLALFTIALLLLIGDLDVYNPKCWFPFVFYLYSVSYPITYLLGFSNAKYGCSKDLIPIQFVGLVFFVIGTYLPVMRIGVRLKYPLRKGKHYPLGVLRLVIEMGNVLILAGFIMIVGGDFSGKRNLYETANIFVLFILKYVYIHILMVYFYWIKNEQKDKTVIFALIVIVLLGFASGERDMIFRIIVITGLLLVRKGVINRGAIIVIMPAVLLSLPISVSLKYVLMGASANFDFWGDVNSLISAFFSSDFTAASRNLQIMLNSISSFDYNWLSVFQTISLIFFSGNYLSPQTFFNNVILGNISTGYGFTIIGEGYVYGGVTGVALMMLFVGYLSKCFYVKSFDSEIAQTIYLFMVPLFMYSCRGEIISILSPLCKYVLVGYLVIYFLQFIRDINVK